MAIVETDLIDGNEMPDASANAAADWLVPVFKSDGTDEGGIDVSQLVDLKVMTVPDAGTASTTTTFTTDLPVWIASTKRWYEYVASQSSLHNDGDECVFINSGGALKAVTPRPWRGAGVGYRDYRYNPYDRIDSTPLHSTLLITTSSYIWSSAIGVQTKPIGITNAISDPNKATDAEAGVPWQDDTAYPTGIADVATLLGGYDNVNNQLAGTMVGGAHNYLQYNVSGHGTMIGGSNSRNAGAYNATLGGTQNTITSGSYGVILGGALNVNMASYGSIIASSNSRLTALGAESSIVGGEYHRMNSSRAVILGGRRHLISHPNAVTMGDDTVTEAGGFLHNSAKALVVAGDAQIMEGVLAIRTTGSAGTNMSGVNNALPSFSTTATDISILLEATVIGRDEATGDTAAFKIEAVAKWDGTTNEVVKDSVSYTGSQEPSFEVILDQIGVTAPTLPFNTGALRPRVYGKTATNINWSCRMKMVTVRT